MDGRHILDKDDNRILWKAMHTLDDCIEELLERGVRPANIEIELMWHIKKLLKGD
jgi:hypothetical protein